MNTRNIFAIPPVVPPSKVGKGDSLVRDCGTALPFHNPQLTFLPRQTHNLVDPGVFGGGTLLVCSPALHQMQCGASVAKGRVGAK